MKKTLSRKNALHNSESIKSQEPLISELCLKGFKGFTNLQISQISRVTLLGGRNNVGKTSILEAIFMFFDRMNAQMILRQFGMRGVGAIPFDPQSMWAPIFFDYNLDQEVEISIIIAGEKETLRLAYNPRFEASSISARTVVPGFIPTQIKTDQKPSPSFSLDITYEKKREKQIAHLLMGLNSLELRMERMQLNSRPATLVSARNHSNPVEDAHRFGQLDIIGKQDAIVTFLNIIEPRLKSLSSVAMGDSSLIHGDIGLSRKIPVSYMGDGISRLLSIILAIATTKDGVVLIDECENGLHHSVMPRIWKAIGQAAREYNCQVICTTHSYECLAAAQEGLSGDLAEDFSYIRIDRDDGNCTAKHFDHEMLTMAVKNNMEVR
jgi:predicted ATPase